MDTLALTFSSGWASGVNAYLMVLVLGVVRRGWRRWKGRSGRMAQPAG